jgi:glycosyltransferase involved in cell wall biosynthesis
MHTSQKIIVVSQHYPPDRSTTAAILSAISEHLTDVAPVLVVSGMRGSASLGSKKGVSIVEVRNSMPPKRALIRRAAAELLFAIRTFFLLLESSKKGDVVLTVTAPFLLPYAVVAATKLKQARSVLILHDLFPDVLVVAGVIGPRSLIARMLRGANRLLFAGLSAIVTIGRDTERLLQQYGPVACAKIYMIPNWATLTPWVRPAGSDNPFRPARNASFVVGLSGNLGFTHDPMVVYEAASLLRNNSKIHFLLSGWGIGFQELKDRQLDFNLPNVTFVDRVEERDLENLLSAADLWVIPYREKAAGVSIPSRFYNLLAVGRPVVIISEPDAEAAVIVRENDLGWVVSPNEVSELASVLRSASLSRDLLMAERAVAVAKNYGRKRALDRYGSLVGKLLRNGSPSEVVP